MSMVLYPDNNRHVLIENMYFFFYSLVQGCCSTVLLHSLKNIIQNLLYIVTFCMTHQRRIQNSVKHLRWIFLRRQLSVENFKLFSQKALSQMFDIVLNAPLHTFDTSHFTSHSCNKRHGGIIFVIDLCFVSRMCTF